MTLPIVRASSELDRRADRRQLDQHVLRGRRHEDSHGLVSARQVEETTLRQRRAPVVRPKEHRAGADVREPSHATKKVQRAAATSTGPNDLARDPSI